MISFLKFQKYSKKFGDYHSKFFSKSYLHSSFTICFMSNENRNNRDVNAGKYLFSKK